MLKVLIGRIMEHLPDNNLGDEIFFFLLPYSDWEDEVLTFEECREELEELVNEYNLDDAELN